MFKLLFPILLIILSACNPLSEGQEGSYKSEEYNPGLTRGNDSGNDPQYEDFHKNWNLSNSTEYDYSSSEIEISSGVARLIGNDQMDDGNTLRGFTEGVSVGVDFDSATSSLKLSSSTNLSEMDPSWTPKYSDIVGYWNFDGPVGPLTNGSVIPAVIGEDAVAQNVLGLSYVEGKIGQAANFTPNRDMMKVNSSLPISNKYSMSFWIKLNSFPATISAPLSTTMNGAFIWELFFTGTYTSDGSQQYSIVTVGHGATRTKARTFTTSHLGTWHHIAVTYDSSSADKTSIYFNGNLLDEHVDTSDGSFPAHNAFWIGGKRGDNNSCCNSSGQIDELVIWNKSLDAEEIETIYSRQSALYSGNYVSRVMDAFSEDQDWTGFAWSSTLPFFKEIPDATCTPIPPSLTCEYLDFESTSNYSEVYSPTEDNSNSDLVKGPVGLWHLNEDSGTAEAQSVIDSSGQANHGSPQGGVVFGENGKFSGQARFDGVDDEISFPYSPGLNFGTGDFTISLWLMTANTNSYQTILAKDDLLQGNGIILYTNQTNGVLRSWIGGKVLNGTIPLTKGVWQHLVVRRKQGIVTHYVDGKEDLSLLMEGNTDIPNTKMFFGRRSGSLYKFHGSLDEVAMWKRSLKEEEIFQLYRRGANRIKFQVRSCTTSNCLDQESDDNNGRGWKGPTGDNFSFFSELNNTTITLDETALVKSTGPSVLFSDFINPVSNSRFFQYRAFLESDDKNQKCVYDENTLTWCSPELKSVTVRPVHFLKEAVIKGREGIDFIKLISFKEVLGPQGCSEGIVYNLGFGSSASEVKWYWWNGSRWSLSEGSMANTNTAQVISDHIENFSTDVGTGKVFFKAYFRSSGSSVCELESVQVNGKK